MSSSRRGKKRREGSPSPQGRSGSALGLWVLGLLGMGSYAAGLAPFAFLFPGDPPSAPWFLGLAGFLLCCAAFRMGGPAHPPGTLGVLSSGQARIGLGLVMVLGAAFRLYRFGEPHPSWGYDPFWELMEARNSAELGQHALLFQLGGREPLFHYSLVGFWWLFPEASPYLASRIVSVLFDALAVWGLYLLGKEAGGRWVGLTAAALGAASKPMMIMALACTRGVAVTAAAAFLLLFTLRVFRRPDFRHFLQWGIVLGLCAYSYTGIRVLWLWAVVSVLVFAWWKDRISVPSKSSGGSWALHVLALAGGGWVLLGHLKAHHFMGVKGGWLQVLVQGPVLAGLFLLATGAWAFLQWGPGRGRGTALKGWALGTATACLLVLPLLLHQEFARHLGNDSIFSHQGEGAWGQLFGRVKSLFASLFLGGPGAVDRYDLNILGDAQLDLLSIPAVMVGLAYFLGRPGTLSGWLILAGAAGIFPMLVSADPHSVKLLSGLPALFILGALGLDWARNLLPWPARWNWAVWGGRALLFIFWFGALWVLHGRIWGPFAGQRDANLACGLEVLKEPMDKRIYLGQVGDFFLPHQQNILLDGRDLHSLREVNPIDLSQGEKVPAVVIFFPAEDEYEEARPLRERLAREFPGLHWKEYSGAGWHRKLLRLEIPSERVEKAGKFFPLRRQPQAGWRRVFLRETYGLGRGGYVTLEDRCASLDAPAPGGPGMESCRIQGSWKFHRDGMAEISVETRNWLSISLEGRVILRHRPGAVEGGPPLSKVRFPVKAGTQAILVRMHRREGPMPVVRIRAPEGL